MRLLGLALLIPGIILVVYAVNTAPQGFSVTAPTTVCSPGPYPNPPTPAGTTLTTFGGLIGYYSGGNFVTYTGYLSGFQVQAGQVLPCTPPPAPLTTTSTTTSATTTNPFITTTTTASQVTTSTITIIQSVTTSGSSTMTTLTACSNNCSPPPNWYLIGGAALAVFGGLVTFTGKGVKTR